jgi:hypothetical protein
MSTSVYRPHNSSVWYARATRPRALDHLPGPREFRRSTGQRDKRKAKAVAATLVSAQWTAWLELLADPLEVDAVPTVLNAGLVRQLCAVRLYCGMDSDEGHRRGGLRDDELADCAETCAAAERMLRSALSQGPESQHWDHIAREAVEWAASQGHELLPSDPLLSDYVRAFARADLDANAAIARRNQGDAVPTPERPAGEVWTMSHIVPHFLEHKGPTQGTKHVQTIVNAWRLLTDYCGDIPLDEVTSEHIYGFLLGRMKAAHKPWSYDRARGFGQRALRDVFGFARTRGFMKAANPLPPEGLEAFPVVEQDNRHEQPRFPFTPAQLNALFASDWYDPASEVFRGKMREDLGARYWVPLLSTHHGNRVREGVQLVASDFVWEAGVLVLRYREDVEEDSDSAVKQLRSLKCSSSHRAVPVHPKLVELGIAEFVESRRREDGPDAWLFPSCEPNEGGKAPKLGRAYEQAFLRHVRDRLGFGNGFGNHSFRHLLEDKMRDAQARNGAWPPGLGQQYTGRVTVRPQDKSIVAEEGSERLYGKGYTPGAMLRYVEQLEFTGLDYPLPYAAWLG